MIDPIDNAKPTSSNNDTTDPKPSTNPKAKPFPTKPIGESIEPHPMRQPLSEDNRGKE
jgi:hypothetical protein